MFNTVSGCGFTVSRSHDVSCVVDLLYHVCKNTISGCGLTDVHSIVSTHKCCALREGT